VIQELENRTLLSVTASLNATVLDVNLSAAGDQATITPSGSSISVSGTGYSGNSFSGVTAIVVLGANTSSQDDPNQGVTFGGGGGTIALNTAAGTDALNVSGVTSTAFTDVTIDATSGNVDVEVSETTAATNPLTSITYAPQATVTVTGATIKADNITLDASASATDTTNGLLGGTLDASGVAAAISDLQPSATVTVGGSSNITVNRTGGNVAIGAVASATVDSTPQVTSGLLPADAVIATSIVNSTAVAHVGGSSTVSAGSGGTLSITSTNTTSLTTDVDGSSSKAGGGSVAVAIDNSTTQAYVDGGSSVAGGTVDVSATATNTANTTAKATAQGGDSNSGTSNVLSGKVDPTNSNDTAPQAQTSDGPVSVAGAVAVTKFMPTTQAYVDSSAVTATTAINIDASSDNNTSTVADGSATNDNSKNGVGVAVAINDTDASNTATVASTTGTASLSAPTVSVQATTPTASSSDVHNDSASATAGASGSNVGVAGALALNFVSNTSEASVPTGSAVSIGSNGDVTFNAQDSVTEAATAQPAAGSVATGGKVGVGASLALNIATNTTQADLANTAQLTGANSLTLTANSNDTMTSTATAGASGGVAVSPAVAISIANTTTTAQLGTGSTLNLTGALSATATHTGSTTTTGGGTATGTGAAAVGASIALTIATDQTTATTERNIDAGGAVSFLADATATSAANAMASAAGGSSDDGKNDGKDASGNDVDSTNTKQRSFADSEGDSAGAGDSKSDGSTPSASTSDGDVSVAAAVSVNIADSAADATIPDGLSVTSGGLLTVSAQNTTGATSTANGTSSGTDKVGVGAAVALNLVKARTLGAIGAGTTISAQAITVQAQMNSGANTFGASATAGAGASKVGVAGAVGINLVSAASDATIGQSYASSPATPGATVTITAGGTGAVTLTAEEDSTSTASALPATSDGASGSSVGVGAGVGLNIVTNTTLAALANNVSMTGAGALALSATSTDTMTTTATTGAASTGGVAVSAAVSISIANTTTTAQVGSNDTTGTGTLSVGSVSATATHTGSTTSTAGGTAAGSSAGIGASVAINIPTDQTTATTLSSLTATGPLSFTATASGTSGAVTTASASGGPSDDGNNDGKDTSGNSVDSNNSKQRSYANSEGDSAGAGDSKSDGSTPSASTSDGDVSVAAAVSVNIADSEADATIPSGLSITSTGGALTVGASNTTTATSTASGDASGKVQVGVGAAVALNLVKASDEATIEATTLQPTTINTKGVTVQAGMTGTGTPVNAISASATSGAGGTKVGVAGSVAINIVNDTSQALIETGASVAAGGGDVALTSLNNATDTASAVPATDSGASGGKVGIGASLALNIISDTTQSEIQDGAALTGAGGVTVTASSPHTITTTAKNGAAGSVAVGAGIAIVIASDQTTARIGSDTQTLNASGGLTIAASGSFTVVSEADAKAADNGGSVGIGATVVVNVAQDSFLADLDRNVSAGGAVSITDAATASGQATAIASENGAPSTGTDSSSGSNGTADKETQNQSTFAHDEGGSDSPDVAAPPTSNSELSSPSSSASGESGGSSGESKVGIAAAVSVNVLTTSTVAEIDNGLTVTAGGALTVGTTNQTSALALADGRATSNQNSIGAAVSLNVANVTNNATIGSSDTISAHGVNITALMTSGAVNDFSTQGLGVAIGSQVGVAGSVGINVITINTQASIGAGTAVKSFGGLSVQAANDETLQNIAFTLAVGEDAGVGAAVNVDVLNNTTLAFLDSNVQANVADLTQITAESSVKPSTDPIPNSSSDTFIPNSSSESVLVSALSSLHPTAFSAGAGASSGGAGVAGSFIVNVINQTTHAYINNGASINTLVGTAGYPIANADEGVTVSATETMNIVDWAGAVGGGDDAGIGAALDVDIVTEDAQAYIAPNATVDAAQNVMVTSSTNGTFKSITAALALSGSAGIAGAASIEVLSPTTKAYIDSGTTVDAQGDLLVQASRQATINTLAGQLGVSGDASVGAAVSTVVDTVNTNAYIGSNDQITARGTSGSIPVLTGNSAGDTTSFTGVAVVAATFQNVQSIVVGGAVSGSVGIAGSVAVNVLNDTTLAYVAAGATVTATDGSPGSGPGVMVTAADPLTLFSTAGALAVGGDAGLGAGVDVDSITKNTQAYIATATVTADGDVLVQAKSAEDLTSITAAVGASGSVAIVGSAGVYVLGITTRAYIGNDADVQASGSILVAASEATVLDLLSGNFSGSGDASVGAAASVPVINKTTEAFIGAGAHVGALGLGSAINAENGQFAISYQAYGSGAGVAQPKPETATPGGHSLNSPRLGEDRVATPESQSLNGLAVTAVNTDALQGVGVTGGASGAVAVNLSGSVAVLTNHTDAYIGSGAAINSANSKAASGQSVLVAAGNDTSFLGIAASLSISGTVSVAPGVVVLLINNTTTASIDDGASVAAKGDVAVVAHASGDVLTIAAAAAVSGTGSAGGSVSYVGINDTTQANIGDTATSDGAGAQVNAGGNVLVDATDATEAYMITGSLAIGVGGAGIGGAVSIVDLSKNTDAFIGSHATVNALGNTPSLSGIFDGNYTGSGDFETLSSFHGVAVQAATSENVTNIAAAGAAGFYAGLAGGVSIELFSSTTQAYVGNNAHINANSAGASSAQAVDVAAVNQASNFSFAGGLGGGIAGIAGGVDVGLLKNSTQAYIGNGSDVHAQQAVDVYALSNDSVQTDALGAAVGIVGIAGSVSVWSIGVPYSAGYTDGNASNGTIQGVPSSGVTSSSSSAEGQTGGASSMVGSLTNPNNNGAAGNTQYINGTVGSNQGGVNSSITGDPVASAINSTAVPTGTVAFIGSGVSVNAGGNVNVRAKSQVSYTGFVGGLAAGAVGIGGSVEIANIEGSTQAYIDANSTVSAGGNVAVDAELVSDTSNGTAFAGTAGIVGIGAQVVDIQDSSTESATLNSGVTIPQAQQVQVTASSNRSLTALALGGDFGGVAAGVGVAIANATGGPSAGIASGAQIGQTGTVAGLNVAATSTDTVTATSYGVAAGLGLAATGVYADAESSPTVAATIGPGAAITLTGDATVEAIADGVAQATATGVSLSGSAALGLSLAFATLTPTVTAGIGADSRLTTDGDVTVMALNNYTESGNPVDNTVSGTAIAGSGGVLAALSGAVATATNSPTVNAYVGDPADAAPYATTTISAGGNVKLSALSNDVASSKAVGVAVGGLAGISGSGATTTVGGQVTAQLNGNVSQGQNVVVTALATGSSTAEIDAGAAGLLGGVVNLASALLSTGVAALIGNAAVIDVSGVLTETATSDGTSTASGLAYSLGLLAFGVVVTTATITPSVTAAIGSDADITAEGGITVMAIQNATPGASGSPPQPVAGMGAFATSEAPLTLGLGVAGNGAVPTATAQANVAIDVGSAATLSSAGDIRIEADAANIAQANAKALAVSIGAAIGTSISNATAGGGTSAQLDGSVSKANNFFLDANSINSAQTNASATSGAILSGTGATATSTIPSQASTQADAGAGSSLAGVAQTAQIQATAQNRSTAAANGNTFGLVAIGVVLTTATDEAQTAAYTLGNFAGNSLSINAQASDTASSNAGATTGGLIAVAPDNTATTIVQPTVGAAIGGDPLDSSVAASTDTVTASGNVGVTATDNPEGDAATSNATYGGVAVGGSVTNDTISPTVTSYVDTGTTIHAGGNVTVSATGTPQGSTNVPNYTIQSVNTTNNTLDVQNNGLQTGQTVLYDNEGNTPIQGLTGETDGSKPDGMRSYTVLAVDPNHIQFGADFSGSEQGSGTSGVNSSNSTINFPDAVNLQSGDLVQYEPVSSAPPIGGLTPGGEYYVEVVSPTSIRLTNSFAQAVIPQDDLQDFTIAAIGGDGKTITIPNNGFTQGEAVTFQPQAQPQQFSSLSVNVSATYDSQGNPTLHADPGANDIFVYQNPFQTGDTLVYQVQGSNPPIGGLINNHTYQVVDEPSDSNLIQLKDLLNVSSVTFADHAGGDTITRNDGLSWSADGFAASQQITITGAGGNDGLYTIASLNGSQMVLTVKNKVTAATDSNVTFVGPVVVLTPDTSSAGASVVHDLSEESISPLVAGDTYYVTNINSHLGTFQLASSPQNAQNSIAITLNDGGIGSSTVFQIGPQGIPITSSSGSQELVIVLGPSSTVAGTQQLRGPGGVPLSVLFPVVGDGISASSSHGEGGGIVGAASNAANVTASPNVSASVNGPLLTAGGRVSVTSTSNVNASAHTDNGSVGLIGIGNATTTNDETNHNDASVGMNSMIGAGVNFTLAASSSDTNDADVNAGVPISGAGSVDADTTAQVNYVTLATVGQGACIAAGNQIQVVSSTSTDGESTATSNGVGILGLGAYANENGGQGSVIGSGGMSTAENQTEISSDASLYAQSVVLGAMVPNVAMTAYGNATGAGFVGVGVSDGNFTMNAENNVLIDGGASVTGTEGVDILPTFQNINGGVGNPASADATAEGLFGFVSATANNNTNLSSEASSAATALVAAGPRGSGSPPDGLQHPDPTAYNLLALYVDTTPGTINPNQSASVHRKALAAGTDHENGSTNLSQSVPWYANVTIMSSPLDDPTLIIDANGNVVTQIGITFTISGNTIYVNDIADDYTGQVFIDSSADTASNVGNSTDDITGSGATWSFTDTLGAVTIINYSPDNLWINNITVVDQGSTTNHDVTLLAGTSIGLVFSIKHISEPTQVTIENLGASTPNVAGSPGLILNGTINNPIGTTTIIDQNGGITSTNPRGVVGPDGRLSLVVTNILDIEAPNGSIGTLSDRINVDLVQSLNLDDNLTRPTKVTAVAGIDVYFDLQGILRDPDITNFIVNVDSITAGQDIDVLLQGSLDETKVNPLGLGISIFASAPTITPNPPANPIDALFANYFHPDTNNGIVNGLDPGVFADPSQAVPIASTYNFRSLDSDENRSLPGLIAGGNISVKAANPATTVPDQIIHVIGITELLGMGSIDAITSGNITLTEMAGFGPMRIGTVVSTVGDVKLTVPDTPNPGDDLLIIPNGQISAPGGITAPSYSAPQVAPTVNPTGGNTPAVNPSGTGPATVSGYLAPGTYYVVYTFTYPNGTETLSSPSSTPFTVTAGEIPQITLPLLPVGATGYNIYLSNTSATSGSATLYASGVTVSAFNLLNAAPASSALPPATNPLTGAPTVTPTVNPTGGGASGGTLTPGTYFVFYTGVNPSGVQSPPSPSSSPFTAAAGNIPQVTLPPLAGGLTGYDLYLSDATSQSGSAVLYAAGITTTTFNLPADPPNGQVAQPVNNVATVTPVVTVTTNSTAVSWILTSKMSGVPFIAGLAPGTYYVVYTFTYPSGAETFASPPSNLFTVAAGQTAQVTLPPLPPGASGINLYLSDSSADPGSATRYYTGITATTFNLSFAAPTNGLKPPAYDLAPITPKVNVIGGNAYGGNLLQGTYYLEYTFVGPGGVESTPSPASAPFVVAPGNIPQVSLPTLPPGATSYNIYLSDPVSNPGSATLYASGVTTPTYDLTRNALSNDVIPPALKFPTTAPTITAAGGGTSGGLLAPGTYILSYTFVNAAGAETYASPYSAPFTVTAGEIPQVTLPPLPGGVSPDATTAYNIYLSGPSADPTSVIRYAAGVTSSIFNLAAAAPTGDTIRPPAPNPATVAPLVQALGGGPTGGSLGAGTYFVYYTYTYSNGTESAASPSSADFSVAPGYIPLVTLPPLALDATGYNLYLSDPTADPGSATWYASGIATTTWTLANAEPAAGISPPSPSSATTAPTVAAEGGGKSGGHLAPGTYFVLYTYTYPAGTESFPSPSSASFTVAAGNIPQVTLPPLPAGATGYNVYLSNASATAGSALSYITGITTNIVNLAAAAPAGGIAPPTTNSATVTPTVNPTGGNPYGGRLLAGTYFVFYTFSYPGGVETLPSPRSAPFTVAAGNIPQVTLPALPSGATGINLYLSDATGPSGPAVRYASGIKTTTYTLPYDAPVSGTDRPVNPVATVAPTVSPIGGGSTGGQLASGTYYVFYTFNYPGGAYPVGVESAPSPSSLPFTVTAGNIPQVSLPLLPVGIIPVGALSYNIYLSDSSADPNTATRYASGLTGTTFNLVNALTPGAPRAPISNISTIAPTVAPAGGGSTGGQLAPGTYFVSYTFAYPNGTETLPGPNSATFTVAAGNIPQVTLPPLPAGAIGYNIYLSNALATAGSATRYASAITTSTYDLQSASAVGGVSRPLNPAATIAPLVLPVGGGSTQGNLAPGTYYVVYTFTYPSGAESFGSPASALFTVAAGAIPEVILPSLPNGATGYDIYLSDPSADPGSAVRYASGVQSSIVFLQDAAPGGGLALPPTSAASVAPTVNPSGGGSTGGQLLPGTYDLLYTFTYPNGAESFASPLSSLFTVTAGQVPLVTLPPLPSGASGYNLYLSDSAANAGSTTLYAAGVPTSTYGLQRNALSTLVFPPAAGSSPSVPTSEVLPTVSATAGGTTGGQLAPGTYFVFYSPTNAQGAETYLSDSSNTFTVSAGNIPQLSLPPVPDGYTGFDIYLSDSAADPGSGTIYASGVTTPTFNLLWAAHAGGAVSLLVGDNLSIPAPTLVSARQSVTARIDHGNADPGVGRTLNVDAAIVAPFVLLTGEIDNDTFNIQATAPGSAVTVYTGAGANTINLGSKQPQPFAGVADNLQGAELIEGSGNDTANVDDTGSVGPKTGFLTAMPTPAGENDPAGALTGLNMGPLGVAYAGLSNLNITLGSGGSNQPTSPVVGNTFNIYVPSGLNLPGDTTVFGGPSNNDAVTGLWGTNFNTILNLYQFEHGNIHVDNNFTGTMNALLPGSLQNVLIGTAMTPGSILNAGSIDNMVIGSSSSPGQPVVGDNLAGIVNVLGKLGSLVVDGGTPGSISAGSIGTIGVNGGYGPIVAQIKEGGIQRAINATLPDNPYPAPNPAALPAPSGSSYVNFQYFYEGHATGLGNPQLTARVTNGVGAAPDQYDFALTTDNDVAKFNLARLDANGVSGARNIAVEGDLLTTVTPAAQAFFGLASNQGGIVLPKDNLAGVEIRDYAPPDSIQAKSIQAVAFGSTTRLTINHVVYGSSLVSTDAANLLVQGTAIVQAADTFLVPFADLFNQQVAFFMDDVPNTNVNAFDNADVVFDVQSDNGQQENVDRGAVTALITVDKGSYSYSSNTVSSIIQTIDLRGDGGSITSKQWIAQGITSTGPLGDIAVDATLGLTNVTAPSFFGNIDSYGPINGTVQSTGVRVNPIFGTTSTASADIGRAYVTLGANGQPTVTSTAIQSDINGRPAFGPMGLNGQIISRGNLISSLTAAGGIRGIIAVQGDIGATSTLLSRTSPTVVGGISTDTGDSGKIITLGQIVANVSLRGGLLNGGTVAARGSILGNLTITGAIAPGAVVLSGGSIGSAAQGTAFSFGSNQGIIAADGAIVNKTNSPTVPPGYFSSNDATVPPPINFDAQVIDAIFSSAPHTPLTSLDLLANGDLLGLTDILNELALLHVVNNHLSLDPDPAPALVVQSGSQPTLPTDPTAVPTDPSNAPVPSQASTDQPPLNPDDQQVSSPAPLPVTPVATPPPVTPVATPLPVTSVATPPPVVITPPASPGPNSGSEPGATVSTPGLPDPTTTQVSLVQQTTPAGSLTVQSASGQTVMLPVSTAQPSNSQSAKPPVNQGQQAASSGGAAALAHRKVPGHFLGKTLSPRPSPSHSHPVAKLHRNEIVPKHHEPK
jgi:hypothetical protein